MNPDVAYYAIHTDTGHVLGIILGFERKEEYFIFGLNPKVTKLDVAQTELKKYIKGTIRWHKERF